MTAVPVGRARLALLSNGYAPGSTRYLEHTLGMLAEMLSGVRRMAFIPYAQRDLDRHTAVVAEGLAPLGIQLIPIHRSASPRDAVAAAEALMGGGGNAFRLLARRAPARPVCDDPVAGGRGHALRGVQRRHQPRLSDHPHHQRHADRPRPRPS